MMESRRPLTGITACVVVVFWAACCSAAAQPASLCSQVTDIPTAECEALEALYSTLNGPGWRAADGWLRSPYACQWTGIECADGHVTRLALQGNGLTGRLPAAIGALAGLETLDLSDNALSGPIPAEIGHLTRLRGLNLRNNQLSGPLPEEIGRLRRLEWLYLSENAIDGALPASLMLLSDLETLYMRETAICEPLQPDFQEWLASIPALGRSEIPCDCAQITDIPRAECRALFALYAQTEGRAWRRNADWLLTLSPCAWEQVECEDGHVTALRLADNRLRGTLPPELGHFTTLVSLDVSENLLLGPLPPEIHQLARLQSFNASHNGLSGLLPAEIGELRQLTEFDVSDNGFTGPLPASIGQLDALRSLNVSRNDLSGMLPSAFGRLSALEALDVSQNSVYGPLPQSYATLQALQILRLNATSLRGTLPVALARLPNLSVVAIDQSHLCLPDHAEFQQWARTIDVSGATNRACPVPYSGLLPALLIIVAGAVLVLPGGYRACVRVFGESFTPPERLRGYYRKLGTPKEGLPIQMLITGLFAFSAELMWGACAQFSRSALGYGFGVGLLLYLGYIILVRRLPRRQRITWIGRILGVVMCGFLGGFLLLTVDVPYSPGQLTGLAGYILLVMAAVWFMTSGVSVGGYWELMAEGLLLGALWGVLTGGILGEAFCAQAPLLYGGMSDILTYRVFSLTLPETTRRFMANELTGIFLFSLLGTIAGALARTLQTPFSHMQFPIHRWLSTHLQPILKTLQKSA